jgi:Trk K+ transport system NAD-binding subunit
MGNFFSYRAMNWVMKERESLLDSTLNSYALIHPKEECPVCLQESYLEKNSNICLACHAKAELGGVDKKDIPAVRKVISAKNVNYFWGKDKRIFKKIPADLLVTSEKIAGTFMVDGVECLESVRKFAEETGKSSIAIFFPNDKKELALKTIDVFDGFDGKVTVFYLFEGK